MAKIDWQQRADDIFNKWVVACNGVDFDNDLLHSMIESEWCKHQNAIPVAQTMYNGERRRWWICAECGKGGLPKPKNAPAKFDVNQLVPLSAYETMASEATNARLELSRKGRQAIKQKYYDYLQTPAWQTRRTAVLKRDGFACRYCGNKATQVHHLTYDNIYNEPLEDLVSICKPCHEKEHWYKQERTK